MEANQASGQQQGSQNFFKIEIFLQEVSWMGHVFGDLRLLLMIISSLDLWVMGMKQNKKLILQTPWQTIHPACLPGDGVNI